MDSFDHSFIIGGRKIRNKINPDLSQQCIGLGKKLPLSDMAEYRAVAPYIVALNGHAAAQHKPHSLCQISCVQDKGVLFVGFFCRFKLFETVGHLVICQLLSEPLVLSNYGLREENVYYKMNVMF